MTTNPADAVPDLVIPAEPPNAPNALPAEMVKPPMILETVDIIQRALSQEITINVPVNNLAGGNAILCLRTQ